MDTPRSYVVGQVLIANGVPYSIRSVSVEAYDQTEAIQSANVETFAAIPGDHTVRVVFAGAWTVNAAERAKSLGADYLLAHAPSRTTA